MPLSHLSPPATCSNSDFRRTVVRFKQKETRKATRFPTLAQCPEFQPTVLSPELSLAGAGVVYSCSMILQRSFEYRIPKFVEKFIVKVFKDTQATEDPGRLRLNQGASLRPDESEGCSSLSPAQLTCEKILGGRKLRNARTQRQETGQNGFWRAAPKWYTENHKNTVFCVFQFAPRRTRARRATGSTVTSRPPTALLWDHFQPFCRLGFDRRPCERASRVQTPRPAPGRRERESL